MPHPRQVQHLYRLHPHEIVLHREQPLCTRWSPTNPAYAPSRTRNKKRVPWASILTLWLATLTTWYWRWIMRVSPYIFWFMLEQAQCLAMRIESELDVCTCTRTRRKIVCVGGGYSQLLFDYQHSTNMACTFDFNWRWFSYTHIIPLRFSESCQRFDTSEFLVKYWNTWCLPKQIMGLLWHDILYTQLQYID